MRLCLLLLLLLSTWTARAQDQAPPQSLPAPPLVDADARPEPPPPGRGGDHTVVLRKGDKLSVYMPGRRSYSGELLSLMPGELSLQLGSQQVVNLSLTDVERLEREHRWFGQGLLLGGGIGGLGGGLVAGTLCVLLSAVGGQIDLLSCAGTGVLVGGAIGIGVGAVVGLTTIRRTTLYEKATHGALSLSLEEPDVVVARGYSGEGRLLELGLQLGYARDSGIPDPTDGWGGRFHVLFLLGPIFSIGPEVAWYPNVGDETVVQPNGQSWRDERSLFQFNGVVRSGVKVGPTRPAVMVAVGVQSNRNSNLGGSLGAEVEVHPWERLPPFAVDVRYHVNLDRNSGEDLQNFVTLGLGSRVRW
jgi:hypothetical protein